MSIATNSVMWFRRDLRLADNEALVAAARAGSVTPLFVIDPMFFERSGAPRLAFLLLLENDSSKNTSPVDSLVPVILLLLFPNLKLKYK